MAYGQAMQAEQAPKTEGPSEALTALYAKRDELQRQLDVTRKSRAENALSAAEGNAKARAKVDHAFDTHAAGIIALSNLNLAIEQAEKRDAKERVLSAEADADEKYHAAQAVGADMIAWGEHLDKLLNGLNAHNSKLPELRKRLAKSGADIDTVRINTMFSTATFDRAAKVAGLHKCFSIDAGSLLAAPMAESFRALLRVAIRRPRRP